jgi:hypothetical protein
MKLNATSTTSTASEVNGRIVRATPTATHAAPTIGCAHRGKRCTDQPYAPRRHG